MLCNNEIAIPALRELAFYGALKAVVVPEKNRELFLNLQQLLTGTGINLVSVNKNNLTAATGALIQEKEAAMAWLMTFPYVIPTLLLGLAPKGFMNFHYGLLPEYRGSNPILMQMLHNETHNGITVHIADENIDTGPIVMQQKIPVDDKDTFGIQLQKLAVLGAAMAVDLLKILNFSPRLPSVLQDETKARYFGKVTAADLMINWNSMTSRQIVRLINACNPWNKGAGTVINNQIICFTEAEVTDNVATGEPVAGTVVNLDDKEGLKIVCSDRKIIRVNIIYTPYGFFSGKRLSDYGVKVNDRFT